MSKERTDARAFIIRLLASMESWNASDLFLTEDRPPAARIHGRVVTTELPTVTKASMDALVDEVLTGDGRERLQREGDVDAGYTLKGGARFRFNFAKQRGKIATVVRALPSGALDLKKLGLPAAAAEFADAPRGIVLVTGATGSGKSTTLAGMIHRINTRRHLHIVTMEEPIEFVHKDRLSRITQREVGTDTESFRSALKHVVRQSPDVIVIGELRDMETMEVALAAALTGHLVIATLHTINATQSIQRLMSLFPEHRRTQAAMDLSLSLVGIVSQRLVVTFEGEPRALAVEVMTAGPAVRRLIRENRSEELEDLMASTSDPGMRTFNASMVDLFQRGKISFETGKAYATNPDAFALAAQGMNTGVDSLRRKDGETKSGINMKSLIELVLERGASDLHLAVGRPPIFRIDGVLQPLSTSPLTAADMRLLLFSILTGRQRSKYELEREIDFALSGERGKRFRVNAYYQKGNMAAALRAIPSEVPDAAALGIPHTVMKLAERPHGLLLVVGPTGSGKTTTLACMVDQINQTRSCRILTVEDPIEYVHESKVATIDQREVFADTLSFSAALKYVLRQDPDVILVGEMRDLETISSAMTAAETGHLVLATLHTNDAIKAVDRIIDIFPSHQQSQVRAQLAGSLLGVVSQRLLPHARGGGRVAAFEVLVGTPAIRTLIRDAKTHQAAALMQSSHAAGMMTLDRSLRALYEGGMITLADAQRYARNPQAIAPPR